MSGGSSPVTLRPRFYELRVLSSPVQFYSVHIVRCNLGSM